MKSRSKGVLHAASDTQRGGGWVLVATILGSSMAFIDSSVVNVALPVIQRDLSATATDVQWVVEAYALFLSALILVGGSLGDRFGRRRVFALGITIFALSSMWCGLSTQIVLLIIARAMQGIGGALLVPGSLAIITATFGDAQRGRAIGTWSGFSAITSLVGPVLGGVLVQYASWHWVFFLNVPLAVVVLVLLFWRVPESRDEAAAGRLDWWGALLVTLGLGAVVLGLMQAGAVGLGDPVVLGMLVAGVVSLVAFLLVEAHTRTPMVPLTLFRSHTFSGSNLLTFSLYGAMGSLTFFLPFNLIQVQGYSPTSAAFAFVPFALMMFLLSRWTGGLVNRFGAKLPLVIGPVVTACGFVLFALPGITGGVDQYWTTFFPAVLVASIGMSITVPPLTTAVLGAVEKRHAGIASGINNAVARTAGLLAIAVFGIVVLAVFKSNLDSQLAALHLSPALRALIDGQSSKLAAIAIPTNISGVAQAALKRAIDTSFVTSFRLVALICAALALASAGSALLLVEGKKPTTPSPS